MNNERHTRTNHEYLMSLLRIATLFTLLLVPAVTSRAEPIQWLASEGGNGHFYELVFKAPQEQLLGWHQSRAAAEARSWQGVAGHLATLTSIPELEFVYGNVFEIPEVNSDMFWIGGFQDRTAPEYREPSRGWRWVTGEPFSWTPNTRLPDEPNDSPPREDFLTMLSGGWNDLRDTEVSRLDEVRGYIVEYPVSVPEPATVTLCLIGAGCWMAVAVRKQHHRLGAAEA